MSRLIGLWERVSFNGLIKENPENYFQEIVFLNRFSAVLLLILSAYFPIHLLLVGEPLSIIVGLFLVSLLISLTLTNYKFYSLARIHFLISVNIFLFFLVVKSHAELGNEQLYIPASMLGIILFRKNKFWMYGMPVISILFYFLTISIGHQFEIELSIPEERIRIARMMGTILNFVFVLTILLSVRSVTREFSSIIKEKSKQLKQKNKEIDDSIRYAERIQSALLPDLTRLNDFISGYSLLFKPKDKVSGDFTYKYTVSPEEFWVATADSTGHGVPGAMVSVVCGSALHRTIRENPDDKPAEILDKTGVLVEMLFNKKNAKTQVKDGMDIGLLRIKKEQEGFKISWAGAQQSLLIITHRNIALDYDSVLECTQHNGRYLFVLKPDRQAIGLVENRVRFTNHEFTLYPGDRIVMASDGFYDQFGGDNSKKLRAKHFRHLMLQYAETEITKIEKPLNNFFESWRGENEQIDDVTVLTLEL